MKKYILLLSISLLSILNFNALTMGLNNTLTDAEVIGTWTLSVDWDCNGSTNPGDITFIADYTFTSTGGYSGTWVSTGSAITWTHNSGAHAVYTGTINGNEITGSIATDNDPNAGCFNANKDTTSNKDFEIFNFQFYPNPIVNEINLSANKNIDNIQITSVLGKIVIDINFVQPNPRIDLSNLNSGIYLMTVSIANKKNTFKIIKQ